MAKYKGREVTVVSFDTKEDMVNITQDALGGDKAVVALSDLLLTDAEQKKYLEDAKKDLKSFSDKSDAQRAEVKKVEDRVQKDADQVKKDADKAKADAKAKEDALRLNRPTVVVQPKSLFK